ncbi:MAG: hypothetical protein AB1345_00040 [Chloroflexota bacterium]
MKPKLSIIGQFPWHSLLFGIYPVLTLYAYNINEVIPDVVIRPLIVTVLLTLTLLGILKLLFRDWHRAALVTSVLLILFFSYGHVYNYLKTMNLIGLILGRHRYLLPLWAVLGGLLVWWMTRKSVNPRAWTSPLNLIAVFILLFPVYQLTDYALRNVRASTDQAETAHNPQELHLPTDQPPPDIYYIILDSYGRSDVLREFYNLDNTPFLDELIAMGFYVASCSQSNYTQTVLSLTSSLNLNYLEALDDEFVAGNTDRSPLRNLVRNNFVRRTLEGLGYKTVTFKTGLPATEWEEADVYLEPTQSWFRVNEFEFMLIQTTLGRLLQDAAKKLIPPEEKGTPNWYRERTLFALAALEDYVPSLRGPKFVFAHIITPHFPFVFGPNGEAIEPVYFKPWDDPDKADFETYAIGYRNQVIYISREITRVVQQMISKSQTPPIIIIQADHGPTPWEHVENRTYILNAYYLPHGSEALYETISPVNTFRVIFNSYFGGDYGLLEDISYQSWYKRPYDFTVIPNQCDHSQTPP